jgi:uncharacterized OB-fold protein
MSTTTPTVTPTYGPRPVVENATSAPFWAGVREHRLLLQYDAQAKRHLFYPRPLGLNAANAPLEWRESKGRGKLVAFTLTHFPAPGFEAITPYVEALIQLDEGPRIFAPLQGTPYEQLAVGQRARIAWPAHSLLKTHPFWFELDT